MPAPGGGRRQRSSQQAGAARPGDVGRQGSRRGQRPGGLDTGLDPRAGRGAPSPSPLLVNPPTAGGRRMSAGVGVHPYSSASPAPGGPQGYGSAGPAMGAHMRGMTGDDSMGGYGGTTGRGSAMGYNNANRYGSAVAVRGAVGPMGSGMVASNVGGMGGMGPVPEETQKKGFLSVLCCR